MSQTKNYTTHMSVKKQSSRPLKAQARDRARSFLLHPIAQGELHGCTQAEGRKHSAPSVVRTVRSTSHATGTGRGRELHLLMRPPTVTPGPTNSTETPHLEDSGVAETLRG